MKNILLIAFAIMPMLSKGQITLEHTYAGATYQILFSSNGEKIMTYDTTAIYLYNMNHTPWKTIHHPLYTNKRLIGVLLVSDNLFNSDNTVEMVVIYYDYSATPFTYKGLVIDEHGAIVMDLGACSSASVHYNSEGGNYKMVTSEYITSPASYQYSYYSVPGTLPCGKCGTSGTESVDHAHGGNTGINAYPNPSGGMTVITYDLPTGTPNGLITLYNANGQVSRVYPVNSNSRELIINSNDLAPGMYSYSLSGDGVAPVTKKLIIAN